MKVLNLTADTPELQRIKDYLQENASDILADKINNGTPFEKDSKPLINKKNLTGFMAYAVEEARKIAEKNARYACVEEKTVFGWATHYFEEDSIEGCLFYMDGAEYKPAPKAKPKTTTAVPAKTVSQKKESLQFSLFDTLDEEQTNDDTVTTENDKKPDILNNAGVTENDKKPDISSYSDELENAIKGQIITEDGEIIDYEDFDGNLEDEPEEEPNDAFMPSQEPKGTPLYQRYKRIQNAYPDSVILMRLGDFYEVFGDMATIVANELNLTLTGRDCGLESRVPMCGFPYHCADKYFQTINANHNLVIIESDKDSDTKYLPKNDKKPDIFQKHEITENDKKPDISTKLDNPIIAKLKAVFGNDLEVK